MDERSNPGLSDERIDAAPAPIKALFREYEIHLVLQALSMAGINGPPENYTEAQIEAGAADAKKILDAEVRRRMEALLGSR